MSNFEEVVERQIVDAYGFGGDHYVKTIVEAHIAAVSDAQRRIAEWAVSGDTGISSEAILAHMTGAELGSAFGRMPPSDAADRGRCIRLLQKFPEWLPRLHEMDSYGRGWPEQVVMILDEIGKEN